MGPANVTKCLSLLTCFSQRSHLRGEDTNSRGWCSIQTLSSWMSSAPAATESPPSSLTRTLSWSAPAAPPCCVTPPGAAPSSQKDVLSEGKIDFQFWLL